MSHGRRDQIVVDGRRRGYDASIDRVRAEVAMEFAPELAKAGFWRRVLLRIRIRREIERRMRRIAPPWGLYLTPTSKAGEKSSGVKAVRGSIFYALAFAAIVIAFLLIRRMENPRVQDLAFAPALSLPPALLTAQELGERRLIFDNRTGAGWRIDGRHAIRNGTLELGGPEAATATIEREFEAGESLDFHFFQEGSAGAKLWIKPILIDPEDHAAEFLRDVESDLNLSGFLYKRWHATSVRFTYEKETAKIDIKVRPFHDDRGKGGGAAHSLSVEHGVRFHVVFAAGPGARLFCAMSLPGKRQTTEPLCLAHPTQQKRESASVAVRSLD